MGNQNQLTNQKKKKKPKIVKEAVIFKAKEEEPIISEEEEEELEPVRKVVVPIPAPEPKKFDKKPRPVAQLTKIEPEPEGVLEEQEPGVPAKKHKNQLKQLRKSL